MAIGAMISGEDVGRTNRRGGVSRRGRMNSLTGLPSVSDPDRAYANITRGEYMDFRENYGDFEDELLERAQTDTSLIDSAREDSAMAAQLTADIAERNRQRYGAALTPAQLEQQQRALDRGTTLGTIQSINDARIAQKEANQGMMADLINIGQGINRASQSQLGSAAADATNRKNAYAQARAASKAATYQTVGSLGAAAILAFAF